MRKALNENPMVQLAVFGIAGIAVVLIVFTGVLKGGGSTGADSATSTTSPAATSAATTPAADAAPSASAASSSSSAVPDAAATSPAPTTTSPPAADAGSSDGLLPTKGLPSDVLVAYAKDKAIALLVVDPKAIGAGKIRDYTQRLASRDDVEVFVVKSKDIARYSRITAGVSVSRVPALVVIRPRKLTGSVPTASVSYGFRGPKSVATALDDALYEGGQVPAYP